MHSGFISYRKESTLKNLGIERTKKIKKTNRYGDSMRRKIKIGIGVIGLIIAVIIIGVAVSVYPMYQAAQKLEMPNQGIAGIEKTEKKELTVKNSIDFKNPESKIKIQKLTYKGRIEDKFLGKGSKKNFAIEQGESTERFNFTVDLKDLDEPTKKLLFQDKAKFTIKGEVTVPIEWFGTVTLTTYTIPFSYTETEELPSLQREEILK